eukprot:tig00020912_g15813.t1
MALNAADMNLLSQHLAAASGVFAAAAAAPAPPHNANIHQVLQQILQQVQQIQPMQLQIQQMMQQQQQISHQQHQILNRMDNGTRGDGFDDPFSYSDPQSGSSLGSHEPATGRGASVL